MSLDVPERVRTGFMLGVIMATLYSAYALILYAVRGAEPFARNGTTVQAVLLAYYVAGCVGGIVVGALSARARSWLGQMGVGIVAAFIFFLCIHIAMDGTPWTWSGRVWRSLLVLACLGGITGTAIVRRNPY